LWKEGVSYLPVGLAYAFVGLGIGLAGTPASRSLTGSVPVTRVGMASGTADLQRDLGGAIFNSLFGALLAAGYAAAMNAAISGTGDAAEVPATVTNSLTMSYAGAQAVAAQYPQYASQITAVAKTSFLAGDQYAYIAGIIAVLIGAALVFFIFPKTGQGAPGAGRVSSAGHGSHGRGGDGEAAGRTRICQRKVNEKRGYISPTDSILRNLS